MWPEVITSVVYFAFALFSATHHKLWFDELNTTLLSRLSFHELWRALASGADTNPPLLYLPVHVLNHFTSNAELACRLPSIVEFFVMMVAIYWIARKYVSSLYALTGAFIPFLTIAGSYAVEGRGYAATLGFSALALLCWRNAAVSHRRLLWLSGISISIAAAVANHYSAALIIAALAAGEAVRTIMRRQVDWSIAAAIAVGGVPLILCRPLLGAIHRYLISYWAAPSVLEIFLALKGWRLAGILIVFLLGISVIQRRRGAYPNRFDLRLPIPVYELAAWIVLLLSPVEGYLQGLITGGFTMRYALPMVIPIALFITCYGYRVLRGAAVPGLLLLAVLVSNCAEKLYIVTVRPIVFGEEATWIEKNAPRNSAPLVIGNPVLFSPLYFYAGEPLKRRLAYVSNPELSTKYLHMSSPDLNLSELKKFSPLPVFDYAAFRTSRTPFTLVNDPQSWLLSKLADDNIPVQKLSCQNNWCIYSVLPD